MNMEDKKQSDLNKDIILIVKNEHPRTVKQLVELVRQQNTLPKQKIIEHIVNLQKQGKLSLNDDKTHVSLSFMSYLFSPYSYWYWIVVTLALITTFTILAIPENAYPLIYARYFLGSIFILFLPGYTLIRALFPKKELDTIERIAISIGMSLAIVPIVGLILNYTSWGIRTNPITISFLAITIIFASSAIIREHQQKQILIPPS